MSLLLDAAGFAARRPVATGPLRELAEGLRRELAPVLAGRVELPREKALLSRTGGRCPRDGTLLTFDPLDPRHRCPRCGLEVSGEMHDRFRPYWYQLWLAERVLHAATLGLLLEDRECERAAVALLDAYADRYLDYPNSDNVLGPSRPFFSTYLESIWLLQLALALDLLETGAPSATRSLGDKVRDRLIQPSATLIASYDEGMSNRQVWNNAALLAAGVLLDERALVERAIVGRSGLEAHLRDSLLDDGSWYEGENYHLFAHRGLWCGVMMAERLGAALPRPLARKFDAGFAAPFRTVLPDLTYPSRRDSQYAVSVRQPRFAELCELGLARGDDARLVGMLARLYDPRIERGDTGRAASTADVERNLPATALTRADLSWRSLLFARAELPLLVPGPLESDLLPAQGFGIIRRDEGRAYVALDYGHSGGGHGHPDRLNLLLSDGDVRWFDDPGTGSYTDESLHWYRSTLAHTAPLIDGRSQQRVDGVLHAFDDVGDAGWISASAPLDQGMRVRRNVIVMHGYLVDVVSWDSAPSARTVTLPFHGVRVRAMNGDDLPSAPRAIEGGRGREDGFAFLHDTAHLAVPDDGRLQLIGVRSGDTAGSSLRGWIFLDPGSDADCWSAVAPGAPGRDPQPMVLVSGSARSGTICGVWSWRDEVIAVSRAGAELRVQLAGGVEHVHAPSGDAWRIIIQGTTDPRVITLAGVASATSTAREAEGASGSASQAIAQHSAPLPARVELGAPHYRRSELSWLEAGGPRATVSLSIDRAESALVVLVDVPHSHRLFLPIDAENPFDNEPMAINGDSVQLYVDVGSEKCGWLLVPVAHGERVSVRPIDGWTGDLGVTAHWTRFADGYQLTARISLSPATDELRADVIVNETVPGRARRRGLLVMSGAEGEFVYLRGDRHERERLLRFSLADD